MFRNFKILQNQPVFPNPDGLMAFPSLAVSSSIDPKMLQMEKELSPSSMNVNGSSNFNWATTLNGLRHPESYAASPKCSS